MFNHLSQEEIVDFAVHKEPTMPESAIHISSCMTCHDLLVGELNSQKPQGISFSLDIATLFDSHLDYEQLIALVEEPLDEEEIQIANAHLEVCSSCREDLLSLIQFRKQITPYLDITYTPDNSVTGKVRKLWRWHFSFARVAAVIVVLLLILGTSFLLVTGLRKLPVRPTHNLPRK